MENNEPLKKSRKGLLVGIIISITAALAIIITTAVIIIINSKGKDNNPNTNKKPAVDLNLPDDISKVEPDEALYLSLKKLAAGSSSQMLPSGNYIEAEAAVKIKQLAGDALDEIVEKLGINPEGLSLSVDFVNTEDNGLALGMHVGKDNSNLAGIEIFRENDNLIIGAPGIINGYYSVNLKTISQDIKGSAFESLFKQYGVDFDDFENYFSQSGSFSNQITAGSAMGTKLIEKLQSFIQDNEELLRKATVEKIGTSGNATEYRVTYKAHDLENILNRLINIISSFAAQSGLDVSDDLSAEIEDDLSFNVTIGNDFTIRGFELRNPDDPREYLTYEADEKGNVNFEFNAAGKSCTFSKTVSGKNINVNISLSGGSDELTVDIVGRTDVSSTKTVIEIDNLTVKNNGKTLAVLGIDMSAKAAPSKLKVPANVTKLFDLTENDIMVLIQDMSANILSIATTLGVPMYGIQ